MYVFFTIYQLKSSWVKPDCLIIDLKVPIGISFLGDGKITVLFPFLYLAWLPRCDTCMNPLLSNVVTICFEDGNLDIDVDFAKKCFIYNRYFNL